jgi:hypothetical protein
MDIETGQNCNRKSRYGGYNPGPFEIPQQPTRLLGWINLLAGVGGCVVAYVCGVFWGVCVGRKWGIVAFFWRTGFGDLLLIFSYWLIHRGLIIIDPSPASLYLSAGGYHEVA